MHSSVRGASSLSAPQRHHKVHLYSECAGWAGLWGYCPALEGRILGIKLQWWGFKSWPVAVGVSSWLIQVSVLTGAKHLQRTCYKGKVFQKFKLNISIYIQQCLISTHLPSTPPAVWANQTVLPVRKHWALGMLIWSPFTFPQLLLSFGA